MFQRIKRSNSEEDGPFAERSIPELLSLFVDHVSILFERGNESDVEICIRLIHHHLVTKLSEEISTPLIASLATAIASNVIPLLPKSLFLCFIV